MVRHEAKREGLWLIPNENLLQRQRPKSINARRRPHAKTTSKSVRCGQQRRRHGQARGFPTPAVTRVSGNGYGCRRPRRHERLRVRGRASCRRSPSWRCTCGRRLDAAELTDGIATARNAGRHGIAVSGAGIATVDGIRPDCDWECRRRTNEQLTVP